MASPRPLSAKKSSSPRKSLSPQVQMPSSRRLSSPSDLSSNDSLKKTSVSLYSADRPETPVKIPFSRINSLKNSSPTAAASLYIDDLETLDADEVDARYREASDRMADSISKQDLSELKALLKPPPLLINAVKLVFLLLSNPEDSTPLWKRDWMELRSFLMSASFKDSFLEYAPEAHLSPQVLDTAILMIKQNPDLSVPTAIQRFNNTVQAMIFWSLAVVDFGRLLYRPPTPPPPPPERYIDKHAAKAAREALVAIKKENLFQLKSLPKASPGISISLVGALLLVSESNKIPNHDWATLRTLTCNAAFHKKLLEYDGENTLLPEKVKVMQAFFQANPTFSEKDCGRACETSGLLASWVLNTVQAYLEPPLEIKSANHVLPFQRIRTGEVESDGEDS